MGTLASTNPGLSNLIQVLSNENSPLLSSLSSPAVEAALQKASPEDIVKISDQALQLQMTDALFGQSNPSRSPTNSLFSELEAIGANGNGTQGSLANQLAAYQGSSQLQQTQALLGVTQPAATQSLFDVLA